MISLLGNLHSVSPPPPLVNGSISVGMCVVLPSPMPCPVDECVAAMVICML